MRKTAEVDVPAHYIKETRVPETVVGSKRRRPGRHRRDAGVFIGVRDENVAAGKRNVAAAAARLLIIRNKNGQLRVMTGRIEDKTGGITTLREFEFRDLVGHDNGVLRR